MQRRKKVPYFFLEASWVKVKGNIRRKYSIKVNVPRICTSVQYWNAQHLKPTQCSGVCVAAVALVSTLRDEHKLLTTDSEMYWSDIFILHNQIYPESVLMYISTLCVFQPMIVQHIHVGILRERTEQLWVFLPPRIYLQSLTHKPVKSQIRACIPFQREIWNVFLCKQNKQQSGFQRMQLQGFAQKNLNYWSKLKF